MAVASIVARVEVPVEGKTIQVSDMEPAGLKQWVRDLLFALFEGHEELLGWTPD